MKLTKNKNTDHLEISPKICQQISRFFPLKMNQKMRKKIRVVEHGKIFFSNTPLNDKFWVLFMQNIRYVQILNL